MWDIMWDIRTAITVYSSLILISWFVINIILLINPKSIIDDEPSENRKLKFRYHSTKF